MKKVWRGFRSGIFTLLAAVTASASLFGQAHASPAITEYPVPSAYSNPFSIANGPDGNLWFSEFQPGRIGRVTPSGIVSEYDMPSTDSVIPQVITAPDGSLWFTDDGTNAIGRITITGNVTEFPIPAGPTNRYVGPYGITVGPDGNLWFASNGGIIGNITPNGVITENYVPLTHDEAYSHAFAGITTGSDGALWYTNYGDNSIGRITTLGSITEQYPLPDPNGLPLFITSGPDGALWFTENSGSKIGRITTSGDVTEYPLPASTDPNVEFQGVAGITTGPDGNLWFGVQRVTNDPTLYTGALGRITPQGNIVEYPTSLPVYGITTGPDGAIWFTEGNGAQAGKIGRLVPLSDTTPPTTSGLSWSANPLLQGQNTTLRVSASDDLSGFSSVQYSLNGGTPQAMTFDPTSNTWQATFGSNLSANTYDITVTATDGAGNTSSGTNDILAVYNTSNGYVTGHAKTLPTTSDTMPIARDTSNNPAKLIAGFTNVTSPSSGSFDVDYSIRNKQNEFLLSSNAISWVVVPDSTHASVLGTADLTTYVNGAKSVLQGVSVRFDISLASGSTPAHVTIRIYGPGVNPNTGSPIYTISDDVVTNGSNLMIHP